MAATLSLEEATVTGVLRVGQYSHPTSCGVANCACLLLA